MTRSSRTFRVRWFDVLFTLALAAAYAWLVLRTPDVGEWLVGRVERAVGYGLAVAVALALQLGAPLRGTARVLARGTAMAFGIVICIIAWSRRWELTPTRFTTARAQYSFVSHLQDAQPRDRADWALRVAMHRLTTRAIVASADSLMTVPALTIPASWIFPDDAEVAVASGPGDTVHVWARVPGAPIACQSIPAAAHAPVCDEEGRQRVLFRRPARVPDVSPSSVSTVVGPPWPEYRHDSRKTGTQPLADSGASIDGWDWQSDGPFRASASAVGDLVLIGAHGTGTVAALDVRTGKPRWSSVVPNWVHQDIVSDGRIAVVGFGDNTRSFQGRQPSGVAAYELATGRHLWTTFDEGSVMTSPVLIGDTLVVYGTSTGMIRTRSINTGALIARIELPGGVIMAPPTSAGDTAIFTLDLGLVCALRAQTLEQLWCRQLPWNMRTGHAAGAVHHGLVYTSSPTRIRSLTWDDLWRMPKRQLIDLVWSNIRPRSVAHWSGQRFDALDLRTGEIRWKSRNVSGAREPDGHSSGTPTFSGSLGAVVMVVPDSLVVFDAATGEIQWTSSGLDSRGSPLLVDDKVILSGRDGVTEVRELATGKLTCTMKRVVGYDRAGPIRTHDLLIFAALNGRVEALPTRALLQCDQQALRPRFIERPYAAPKNGH